MTDQRTRGSHDRAAEPEPYVPPRVDDVVAEDEPAVTGAMVVKSPPPDDAVGPEWRPVNGR